MDPKHLMKALAVGYVQEHGGRLMISAERLLELQRAGEISFRAMDNEQKRFMIFLEETRKLHTSPGERVNAVLKCRTCQFVASVSLPQDNYTMVVQSLNTQHDIEEIRQDA